MQETGRFQQPKNRFEHLCVNALFNIFNFAGVFNIGFFKSHDGNNVPMKVGALFTEDGIRKVVVGVDSTTNEAIVARTSVVARKLYARKHQEEALDLVTSHLINTGASDNLHFG